tara:strand:- start:843 stop:1136 length:294 start_codon:yes stop_codon:yes gene_type:complete
MKTIYIHPLSETSCLTHDGYIQIGVFNHSLEKHLKLNPTINWVETYWYPDIFSKRYKRANFQQTEKKNEGSPRTDNASDSRPRDFPDQAQTRLDRTL